MGYEKKLAGSIGGRVHLTVSVKGRLKRGQAQASEWAAKLPGHR